ncbi:MAG: hypothetical protein ACK5RC_07825 [Curvibacter sp.]
MSRALKRQGRFLVLKEAVITSARKLRTYTVRETLGLLAGLVRRGPQAVKQRAGMDFWYVRRDDPRKDR